MRHHLPHTRGIGGRMLLLLLPLRAFGHGGTFKLIDGGIPAGALVDPIAAGVKNPPPPPLAPDIFFFLSHASLPPSPPRGGHDGAPPHPRPAPPPPPPPLPCDMC